MRTLAQIGCRGVHGRDPAAAGAGQRAGALHHLAQDSIDVQALADAQTGLAQLGEAVSQRLVLRSQLVGWLQLPTLAGLRATPSPPRHATGSMQQPDSSRTPISPAPIVSFVVKNHKTVAINGVNITLPPRT